MNGFIGVHRKLMQNAVWTDPNYLKLWMYCMFKASHTQHEQLVGNQKVLLERGQFVTGRQALEMDMNKGVKPKQRLNELTWFRYLKNLEKWEMLNIKSNNKYSLVTVANYDFYQASLKKDEQQTEHQLNNKRTTDEQQMNTNNNVNNVKKKEPSPKRVYDEQNEYYIIADFFVKQIRKNNPNFKTPNMQKWSNEIRLLVEKDEKDKSAVCKIIKKVQEDSFWFSNILSPSKLREKFGMLEMKFLVEGPKQELKKVVNFQKPEAAIKYGELKVEDM